MSPEKRTLLHRHHDKNYIEVIDEGEYRSLFFRGSVVQSRLLLREPEILILRYTQYMMGAALLAQPEPSRVLLIGVGAGALLHFFHSFLPQCMVEAVDYSEHIIKIARGFFSVPENEKIRVHCQDGLHYISTLKPGEYFDLILVDAFNDAGMAKNIYSNEFFKLARQSLSPFGIICCNLWSGNRNVFDTVKKAIHNHSQNALFIPVRKRENIIALLFQSEIPWKAICPSTSDLAALSKRYKFDFAEISTAARKNNMRLGERFQYWLS